MVAAKCIIPVEEEHRAEVLAQIEGTEFGGARRPFEECHSPDLRRDVGRAAFRTWMFTFANAARCFLHCFARRPAILAI
jgi:hypothetical protein